MSDLGETIAPPDLSDLRAVMAYIRRWDWPTDRLQQERLTALLTAAEASRPKLTKHTLICVNCLHEGEPPPPPALSCCPDRKAMMLGDIIEAAEASLTAIHAGWKLVPVEPTKAMLAASWNTVVAATPDERMAMQLCKPHEAHNVKARKRYMAMLAAAPQPPKE